MTADVSAGTLHAPTWYEATVEQHDDTRLQFRPFTFQTEAGLVAGTEFSVQFTLDGSPSEVWPIFRDWNQWMNSYGYFWPGVLAETYSSEDLDLGTQLYHLTVRLEGEPEFQAGPYVTVRVIPEHLLVQFQPILADGPHNGLSNGFHVFMLNDQGDKTLITANMEHATRTTGKTEEEALAELVEFAPKGLAFWRDIFIPNLKRLVNES